MDKNLYKDYENKIYEAIRKVYGYDDLADELVDLVAEWADVCKDTIVE